MCDNNLDYRPLCFWSVNVIVYLMTFKPQKRRQPGGPETGTFVIDLSTPVSLYYVGQLYPALFLSSSCDCFMNSQSSLSFFICHPICVAIDDQIESTINKWNFDWWKIFWICLGLSSVFHGSLAESQRNFSCRQPPGRFCRGSPTKTVNHKQIPSNTTV